MILTIGAILAAVLVIGFIVGWKARGAWEHNHRVYNFQYGWIGRTGTGVGGPF